MEFVGSKTEKNVLAAFAGESQARNRYSYFGKVAKQEGYSRSLPFSYRPRRRRKSMQNSSFRISRAGWWRSWPRTPPA